MKTTLLGNLKRGLLFILSAPTGTGKTTLVQLLTKEFPSVVASISKTTRPQRNNEINGVHYQFINEAEFLRCIDEGEFLEYVQLYGYYYGTSLFWVENQLNQGKHVILVIDTQGAAKVRNKISGPSIFVAPPSIEILQKRLSNRNTESSEELEKRLIWAKEELNRKDDYDYFIINDDLATAYQVLRSILIAEEHRMKYNPKSGNSIQPITL